MNRQRETHPHDFIRVLGNEPCVRTVRMHIVEQLGCFSEAFGPAERLSLKNSNLLFWNFAPAGSNNGAFSLSCRIPNGAKTHGRLVVEVHLAGGPSAKRFTTWTLDRVGAVNNGDESPAFLGAERFAITPAAAV